MLVTGTGASLVGGGDGGPVFPLVDDEDRDEPTTVDLSLVANRTALSANGSVYAVAGTVRNVGNEPGETTVTYRLAGQSLAERTVSLVPGESATVAF